jgi:hypothetical protein
MKAVVWLSAVAGRFRLGGKKEAAGAAVAVIWLEFMEIECRLQFE